MDSALGASTGDYRPGWTNTEELLAVIAETVDRGNRNFATVFSKRGSGSPKPLKIPRPYERKTRRPATSEDLVEMFGGIARYTGPPVPDSRESAP